MAAAPSPVPSRRHLRGDLRASCCLLSFFVRGFLSSVFTSSAQVSPIFLALSSHWLHCCSWSQKMAAQGGLRGTAAPAHAGLLEALSHRAFPYALPLASSLLVVVQPHRLYFFQVEDLWVSREASVESLVCAKHNAKQSTYLIIQTTPRGKCYSYPHFMDEETEAQRG